MSSVRVFYRTELGNTALTPTTEETCYYARTR